jgi:hypothetical protein
MDGWMDYRIALSNPSEVHNCDRFLLSGYAAGDVGWDNTGNRGQIRSYISLKSTQYALVETLTLCPVPRGGGIFIIVFASLHLPAMYVRGGFSTCITLNSLLDK